MCGICGIWGRPEEKAVESMVKAMHHRGPDDRGVFTDSVVSLGMSRLSIIDLSGAAHQPMSNPGKTVWIVYNGETYNFQEERRLLEEKGHEFCSRSDTEVVLRLYEQYGDDFLLRLRGMFALAIYDKRRGPGKEKLLLARDQLGIKPLLFARVGNSLLFASELKALIASGLINTKIDPVSLRMLLTYGSIYQPRTILRNVNMLLPAHRLITEGSTDRLERYWSLDPDRLDASLKEKPYSELVDLVSTTLEESVKLQMVSDVPVGAFLSGGVDSSLLAGLMTRIAGGRVKTFSVGFESEGSKIDESGEAEKTARFLGADHTRVTITGSDIRNRIEHIVRSLDQPSVDGVNSYFVSLAAKNRVTVAISGTGGDEIFAGYPWFIEMARYTERMKREQAGSLPNRMKTALAALPCFGIAAPLFARLRGNDGRKDDNFIAEYAKNYQIFGVYGTEQLLNADLRTEAEAGQPLVADLRGIDEIPHGNAVDRVTALCLRGYTSNQLLRDIDAVSMGHSLEVRVPFLDVPVVDLGLSLPMSTKLGDISQVSRSSYEATYRESGSKRILIDAGRRLGILPEDIDCQPKRGFGLPFETWLKTSIRDVMEDTLSIESVRRRGLLEPDIAEAVKDSFLAGSVHWSQPWLLMLLELWCRVFMDGE